MVKSKLAAVLDFFLSLFLGSVFLFSVPAMAKVCGRVEKAQGTTILLRKVRAKASDDTRRAQLLKVGAKVRCTDVLVTSSDSVVVLKYKKHGTIALGERSRLELLEGDNILHLNYGRLRADVRKAEVAKRLPRKGDMGNLPALMSLSTGAAELVSYGTEFFAYHEPNAGRTVAAAISGKIEVIQKLTGATAWLEKDREVRVTRPEMTEAEQALAAPKGKGDILGDTRSDRPKVFQKISSVPMTAAVRAEIAKITLY